MALKTWRRAHEMKGGVRLVSRDQLNTALYSHPLRGISKFGGEDIETSTSWNPPIYCNPCGELAKVLWYDMETWWRLCIYSTYCGLISQVWEQFSASSGHEPGSEYPYRKDTASIKREDPAHSQASLGRHCIPLLAGTQLCILAS